MTRLHRDVKVVIIQALAGFDSPGQVARMVKAEYGLDVSAQAVEAYDPTKAAGAKLSPELRQIFSDARQRAITAIEDVPEAHKAVRVRMLGQAARRAQVRGNDNAMATLLKQIAEEVGGSFEARRQLNASVYVEARSEPRDKQYNVLDLVRETLGELSALE
ncbi:DUF2280 domain-containing protein [Magnetospirillum gryphiswaldense]|uniref:DUF2280 domain-containing protein n=1 Tax=Magnetospirillum gryphiswaldense TaxID=55518 RepID=UPI000D022905|nr:DUF2280 domain-containing protein [Magnetospirillum gryphiswaldense]AVM76067.1 hypothetical protein MSR1_36060 [Magnetospirillum gryphiswaldense MSR-1]AVM79970.1 hypothetical protein MSR1L_36060 [Magnetospirillum gryphiswaldense]